MRSRGITLIEVLVVLLITVVLAALSFPVLTRAKHKAKETAMVFNLHQTQRSLRRAHCWPVFGLLARTIYIGVAKSSSVELHQKRVIVAYSCFGWYAEIQN